MAATVNFSNTTVGVAGVYAALGTKMLRTRTAWIRSTFESDEARSAFYAQNMSFTATEQDALKSSVYNPSMTSDVAPVGVLNGGGDSGGGSSD